MELQILYAHLPNESFRASYVDDAVHRLHKTLEIVPTILPIKSPTTLLPQLVAYTTSLTDTLTAARTSPPPVGMGVKQRARALLPWFTTKEGGLEAHAGNVLSDLCGSLRDVVAVIEGEGEGVRALEGWMGGEAGGVGEFVFGEGGG